MSVAQAGVAAPLSPPPKQSSMLMPAAMPAQLWPALATKAPPPAPAATASAARMTMNGRAQRNMSAALTSTFNIFRGGRRFKPPGERKTIAPSLRSRIGPHRLAIIVPLPFDGFIVIHDACARNSIGNHPGQRRPPPIVTVPGRTASHRARERLGRSVERRSILNLWSVQSIASSFECVTLWNEIPPLCVSAAMRQGGRPEHRVSLVRF
jgi:hypothetical protein